MKTTFSRQFALIAALLLVCMLFTGVSFRFLMLRYLKNDKKETLSADAQAVASLAEAYDSTGELEENWDFRLSLSLFSDVGEAEALVCDENGFAQTKDLPYGIYSVHQVYLFTLLTTVIISISMNATSSSHMNFKILMIS